MYSTPSVDKVASSRFMISTMSASNAEWSRYTLSVTPRLKEMAGNCVALGRVILMAPGLWSFRNGTSCPVRRRTPRSRRRDDAGHAADAAVFRLAGLPSPRHGVTHVEPFDGIGEVAHEVAPAQLAVREDPEPEILLPGEDSPDVPVLQLTEPLGVRRRAEARLQQLRRP